MGVDYEEYRNKYEVKIKFPFSSSRKRMSTIIDYQNSLHLFIKGASELVLASCSQWFNNLTGEIELINP